MDAPARQTEKSKVFVSYSRTDVAFADQLVELLTDREFEAILDRHDIDPAEPWKDRLGALIFSADTVVFVLTKSSAQSTYCVWEVEEATRLGKRIIPVVIEPLQDVEVPALLGARNFIYFYSSKQKPGSGFYAGSKELETALRMDLSWLRERTRLTEQAARWAARAMESESSLPDNSSMLLRGNILAEAQEWAKSVPENEYVPEEVIRFIDASNRAETLRIEETKKTLEDREAALKEAEAAVKAKVSAENGRRIASLVGFLASAVLLALAGWAYWTSLMNGTKLESERASLFATISTDIRRESDFPAAMMAALNGNLAGEASFVANFVKSEGFDALYDALHESFHQSSLVEIWETGLDVTALELSSDQSLFLVGDRTGNVSGINIRNGEFQWSIKASEAAIWGLKVVPGSETYLAGADDGTVGLWAFGESAPVRRFNAQNGSAVSSIDLSPDASVFAAGFRDGLVAIWNFTTGELLNSQPNNLIAREKTTSIMQTDPSVWSVDFSSTGQRLVSASTDRAIQIWNTPSLTPGRTFINPNGEASSACFHIDDGLVVVGSLDGTTHLWSVDSAYETPYFTFVQTGDWSPVRQVGCFSVEDSESAVSGLREEYFVSGAFSGSLNFWSFSSMGGAPAGMTVKQPIQASLTGGEQMFALTPSADGRHVYSAGRSGIIRRWRVGARTEPVCPNCSAQQLVEEACAYLNEIGYSGFPDRHLSRHTALNDGLVESVCEQYLR